MGMFNCSSSSGGRLILFNRCLDAGHTTILMSSHQSSVTSDVGPDKQHALTMYSDISTCIVILLIGGTVDIKGTDLCGLLSAVDLLVRGIAGAYRSG